ncbi:MAG: amino acid ABC transporter permease [Devosiaceae bacterium]|nr:amino acid ABC transporter permease [Devosiaceae bacterium]
MSKDMQTGTPAASEKVAGFSKQARQQREIRLRRRSTLIATVSTISVFLAIYILVPMAPGWEKVQHSFFNWEIFEKTFPTLLNAFLLDIAIFAWSAPLIAIWGLALALARDARSPALFPLRLFATVYNDIFRGVPVILTIYLIGFGIPGLGLPRPWNSPYIWGSVALVLSYSAYVAEVYRAGIESIHESQRAAAKSLGLSHWDTMRFIILPQAVRRVLPANMNNLISLQKDVALLSFIGPVELLRQAGVFKSFYANFTPYLGAALIFLAVTIPATRFADSLMARQDKERR